MELKLTHRSQEHNNIGPAMLDATPALKQVLVSASSPLTMAELTAIADPAGAAHDDERRYGPRAAKMLSGCKRAVALAPANEKKETFIEVGNLLAEAVRDQWIDRIAMIDNLQHIADRNGRFGLSVEELQQLIANAAQSVIIKPIGSVNRNEAVSTALTRRLIAHRASELQPERLEWVWLGRIAKGKLALLGGPPGLGKSQLTISVAATISNGGDWPCQEGSAPVGSVIFLSAEDGVRDTIIPRLMAAGANRERVHIVEAATKPDGSGRKTFSLKTDIDLLEKLAKEIGDVVLIVIDPISAYMDGTDGNDNAKTRALLEPLAEMADRLGIAVLAVTHLNKNSSGGQTAMNRFCGSIAVIAAARSAYLVVPDVENPDRRLLLQAKNNLAKDSKGVAFRLEQRLVADDIVSSNVIFFNEQVSISIEEALAAYEGRGRNGGRKASARQAVIEFLNEVLANGPVAADEVERQARQAGFLEETKRIGQTKVFNEACADLGIKRKRVVFGGPYVWSLPAAPCAPD